MRKYPSFKGKSEGRLSNESWLDFEVEGVKYAVVGVYNPVVVFDSDQSQVEEISEALIALVKKW